MLPFAAHSSFKLKEGDWGASVPSSTDATFDTYIMIIFIYHLSTSILTCLHILHIKQVELKTVREALTVLHLKQLCIRMYNKHPGYKNKE